LIRPRFGSSCWWCWDCCSCDSATGVAWQVVSATWFDPAPRALSTRAVVPDRIAGTRFPSTWAPPPRGSAAAYADPPAPQSSEAAAAAAASPALKMFIKHIFCMIWYGEKVKKRKRKNVINFIKDRMECVIFIIVTFVSLVLSYSNNIKVFIVY